MEEIVEGDMGLGFGLRSNIRDPILDNAFYPPTFGHFSCGLGLIGERFQLRLFYYFYFHDDELINASIALFVPDCSDRRSLKW